jgi:tetratricopeptide (TPR) repeat protein
MGRIEKTVFICYRRTNIPWALAIFQNLTHHGYDVFFDFNGIANGDFERVIVENINARAHFLVLLTPSALERCDDPTDWLRREIETAFETRRNIIPLMLESFDFGAPTIDRQLTGSLDALKRYNALNVPADYFDAAMDRLREKYLNVALDTVLHPASCSAGRAAKGEQYAARTAPIVTETELTAQEWFERGFDASDPGEKLRFYNNAIGLKPDYADALNNRGIERQAKGDLDDALQDYDEAIRLKSDHAQIFYNRGNARQAKGNLDGALQDYDEAIRLKPDYIRALYNRGCVRQNKNQHTAAVSDFQKYLDLGGGLRDGDTEKVKQRIRYLVQKL